MKLDENNMPVAPRFEPGISIAASEHRRLLDDSRMLKALIAAGARGTKIWNKAAQLLRTDFGQ